MHMFGRREEHFTRRELAQITLDPSLASDFEQTEAAEERALLLR